MAGISVIRNTLEKAASSGRVANAYLLYGGTRDARREEAEFFAGKLVSTAADLQKITHEKPNLISVEEIRTQVVRDALIRPYGSGRKVYVVDEAEKMNPQAQNALLKTLEEPPAYVVILLLSDRQEYFLPTVLSRVVKLSLEEEEEAEEPDAPIRELVLNRLNVQSVIAFSAAQQKKKETRCDFLGFLRTWFRDVLAMKAGAKAAELKNRKDASLVHDYADQLSYESIGRILQEIDRTERAFQANVNYDIAVNLLFAAIRSEMEKSNG